MISNRLMGFLLFSMRIEAKNDYVLIRFDCVSDISSRSPLYLCSPCHRKQIHSNMYSIFRLIRIYKLVKLFGDSEKLV